ncbi:MAG: hypothetical protein JSV21_09820 [Nitrospirota bacterium]|nr:MAG: hypothetical protein JSV21_09820 [Nitrospirota bacterium]
MHPELQVLIELQAMDNEIIDLRDKIDRIPLKVRSVEQPLADAKADFEKKKAQHDSSLKKKKEKDLQLDEINDKINKQKERASDIKNNKEYQAHLKGIEKLESEIIKVEDELLVLMEEVENMMAELKEMESSVKEEEKKIEDYKATLKKEAEEAEKVLESLQSKRTGLADKLSDDTYDLYMKQLDKGQGLAVAEVADEICMGCNMNIPPQLYVEVRKGSEIEQCPQCRRILYFPSKEN